VSEGAVLIPVGGGGAASKYGVLAPLIGGSRRRPWQGKKRIATALGLTASQVKAAFREGPDTRRLLKNAARAAYLTRRAAELAAQGQERKSAKLIARAQRDVGGPTSPAVIYSQAPAPVPPTQPLPAGTGWEALLELVLAIREAMLARQDEALRERESKRALKAALAQSEGFYGPAAQGGDMALTDAFMFAGSPAALPAVAGGAGWLDVLSAALPAAASIYQTARGSGVPMPFGFEEPGGLESGGILERYGLEGDIERTLTPWIRTTGGFRANRMLTAVHPVSGAIGFWRYMGRPVAFSGDRSYLRQLKRHAGAMCTLTGAGGGRRRRTFRRRR